MQTVGVEVAGISVGVEVGVTLTRGGCVEMPEGVAVGIGVTEAVAVAVAVYVGSWGVDEGDGRVLVGVALACGVKLGSVVRVEVGAVV